MLVPLLLSLQGPKVAVRAAVPAIKPVAELRLTVDRATVTKDEDPGYHAVVRNLSPKPLRLLQPQDGSEVGMRNPAVSWVVPDLKNPTPYVRCGNANPITMEAYFTLGPGESREIAVFWPRQAELQPGVNRVAFTYDIRADRRDGAIGPVVIEPEPTPAQKAAETALTEAYRALTPVKLTSNVVRVTLRPSA